MDWNDDGLQDLLVGEYNGHVRYYRNIGTAGNPQFTYQGLLLVGGVTLSVDAHSIPWENDWNEDGKIDLLVGASDGTIYLYINVGTNANPVFNMEQQVRLASGLLLDVGDRSCPSVADLNGDGKKDLISGEMNGLIYYYQNNGTNANPLLANGVPLYTGTIQLNADWTPRQTVVDWDNDGDMDIVVGSFDSRLKRYMRIASTPPAPVCDLTNTGSIYIPSSGGTLTFDFAASNGFATTVSFDAWTDVMLPNYLWYGPLFVRANLSLGPNGSISRGMSQGVPSAAPFGYYYYYGYLGNHTTLQVYTWDYFYFIKTGMDESGDNIWTTTDWENGVRPCEIPIPELRK